MSTNKTLIRRLKKQQSLPKYIKEEDKEKYLIISPRAFSQTSPEDIAKIHPFKFGALSKTFIAQMSKEQLAAITTEQFVEILPRVLASLPSEKLEVLLNKFKNEKKTKVPFFELYREYYEDGSTKDILEESSIELPSYLKKIEEASQAANSHTRLWRKKQAKVRQLIDDDRIFKYRNRIRKSDVAVLWDMTLKSFEDMVPPAYVHPVYGLSNVLNTYEYDYDYLCDYASRNLHLPENLSKDCQEEIEIYADKEGKGYRFHTLPRLYSIKETKRLLNVRNNPYYEQIFNTIYPNTPYLIINGQKKFFKSSILEMKQDAKMSIAIRKLAKDIDFEY